MRAVPGQGALSLNQPLFALIWKQWVPGWKHLAVRERGRSWGSVRHMTCPFGTGDNFISLLFHALLKRQAMDHAAVHYHILI